MTPRPSSGQGSGDDVRHVGIHNQLDSILQLKLSPLQSRDLQLIPRRLRREELDPLIELPVLGSQSVEAGRRLVVVHRFADLAQIGVRGEQHAGAGEA